MNNTLNSFIGSIDYKDLYLQRVEDNEEVELAFCLSTLVERTLVQDVEYLKRSFNIFLQNEKNNYNDLFNCDRDIFRIIADIEDLRDLLKEYVIIKNKNDDRLRDSEEINEDK